MKNLYVIFAGAVGAFMLPVFPYAALSTVLMVAGGLSACAMRRRMGQAPGLFDPRRVGRAIVGLVRIYAALIIARGSDVVFDIDHCLRFTGAAICFQQALTLLEYEASAGGSSWAARLRKYLSDKAGE